MYDVRSPPELLDRLEDAPGEEHGPFGIVLEEDSVVIPVNLLSLEIVLVVNEIHLHSCGRDGSDLDHERSVHVVDDNVHSRKPYDLVELVLPFVYASVAGHERPDFLLPFLDSLGKVSSYPGDVILGKVRVNLGINEQNLLSHIIFNIGSSNKGKKFF